ncbi:MAG: AAA family ATPase [Actinomycetota bacterium]|nr:AAA family ATPase [Actinomycetota bacterium]
MRFLVLGPLHVVEGDAPVSIAGRKERALLALLLSRANSVVSVDEIIEQLWEGAPPRSAAKSLQAHVVRLRQALVDGKPGVTGSPIFTESPGYAIQLRPDQVDALWFRERVQQGAEALHAGAYEVASEALRDAQSTWRGQPYAGFELDWLVEERGRLEQEYMACVEDRVDADLGRGLDRTLVGELETMVADEPLRERRWGQLMLTLYRSSRQADALATFVRVRTLLADELGVDPGDDLVALHARVLDQDPDLLQGSRRHLLELPPELDCSDEMEGREAELADLLGWWQGPEPVCVLAGPGGSGKTRLCAELAATLSRDAVAVLYATARPPTTEPLALLRRLLTRLGMTPAELSVAASEPAELGAAVGRRVARIGAGQRVLVILDDVDAVPEQVLDGVRATIDELTASASVLLAGCDPVEPAGARRIELGPLAHEAVVRIAASYVGPEEAGLLAADVDLHAHGQPAQVHQQIAVLGRRLVEQQVAVAAGRVAEGKSANQAERAKLVSGLKRSERLATSHRSSASASPYMGLSSFGVSDADVFFGREHVIRELLATAASSTIVTLIGPSGTGKSSVARAGFLAALARGTVPGSELWTVVDMAPGRHPAAALASSAGALLERDPAGDGSRTVLLVDQFEEVVTACDDAEERARFLEALTTFAARGVDQALVLMALRDDYLVPATEADPDFAALAVDGLVVLHPMSATDLARVVELPARRRGVSAEPALVNTVVADVADSPGALPLLSTALLELWEDRSGPTLRLAAYERLGGIHRAVGRLAEAVWGRLDPAQQRAARRMLLRMAGEVAGQPVRRRVPLSELESEGETGQRVLRVLAAGRLVTMSNSVDGANVEIVHEAVFAHWQRFAEWLAEDVSARVIQLQVAEHARRWAEGGREPDDLYRGSRLAGALGWNEGHPDVANALEREFLAESHRAVEARADAEREQHARAVRSARRLRVVVAGMVLLLIVSTVSGLIALDQRGTARQSAESAQAETVAARAAELAAASLRQPSVDRALLVAVAAYRMDDTLESRSSLLTLLSQTPRLRRVIGTGDTRITDLAADPDGQVVAVSQADGRVVYTAPLDTDGWTRVPLQGREPALDIAWAPDGSRLAIATAHAVHVVTRAGRTDARFENAGTQTADQVVAVAWLSKSSVVTATRDSHLKVLDIGAGTQSRFARLGADARVTSLAVGPAGQVVASGSQAVTTLLPSTGTRRTVRERNALGPHSWLVDHDRLLGIDGLDMVIRDPGSLRVVRRFEGHQTRVQVVAADPAERVLASAALDGTVALWDARTGAELDSFAYNYGNVSGLAFTNRGGTLVTTGSDGRVIAWDVTGRHGFVRPTGRRPAEVARARAAVDADVHPVEVGDPRDLGAVVARRLEIRPGTLNEVRVGQISSVRRLPGGRGVLAGGSSGRLVLVDATTGDIVHSPLALGSAVNTVEPSPRGTLAAVGIATGLVLIDTDSWRVVAETSESQPVDSIAFDPGSERIALGHRDGSVSVRTWPDLMPVSHTVGRTVSAGPVISLAWTPDGARVVSGGLAGTLDIMDADSGGRAIPGITLHRTPLSVDVSPDGQTLLTSSGDGRVALWDAATGQPVGPPVVTSPGIWVFGSFRAQGRSVLAVSAADGGQVWSWSVDPDRWAARACSAAGRDLTNAERAELGISSNLTVCPPP